MDKSSNTNTKNKNKNTRKYFFNNYNKNIKSRNFEEDKNSPFNNNDNINIKSYEQIYALNKNKYGFSPNEADLSFERNNTLLNDANIRTHDENIYKKILLQNSSKKSDKRTFKIIKCEKINANNNKDNKYNNIEINKHIKKNDMLVNNKKDNLNLENNIVHKTFLSQDLRDGQLPKDYSTSFSNMNLKSENSLNNFRKTIPRTNNNILVNQIIQTEISEPNQNLNFCISKDMNKDIFNTNNKNEIVKGNRVMRKNKLNECRYREKMKKLIKNNNMTSPKTTNENTLENTIKRDNQMDIINKVNHDKNSNSNNKVLPKKYFVSKSSTNILKKEEKEPNTFIKKSDSDINKLKINLFNDDDNNNKNKINSKNKDKNIIFTKKKVKLSNNKDKKKNIKNIYHKSIIKNNNINHVKYKTLEDQKDFIKDESKNKIDKDVLDNSINDTEKEIFYNKLSQNQIKNFINENKNINVFDKYIKNSNSKNKIINYINLNKNNIKNNLINKSEKYNNTNNIENKMKKYLSIRNITIEDINSKSFKNISKSNDHSSYSNYKNNSSRENNNNLKSLSNRIDSNIIVSINKENNNISKINNKITNIKNIGKTKIKKNIMSIKKNNHLIKENEDKIKSSRKINKKIKDYENKNITNYIYNNKPINTKIELSKKKNLDINCNDNILLKTDIKQNKFEFEEKCKNISNLYGSNSKDSEYNNEYINTTKEIIKELNEHDLNNIQINSYESQFISNINSPNSNTLTCFNKSDFKFTNKINFDMPINIDLEKIETEESKEDSKTKISKIKKENKAKKAAIKIDVKQSISSHKSFKYNKFEKLAKFINKLNDEDENEEEEEEPEEEIIIQNNKIVHYNSDIPAYGRSVAEIKLSKDNTSNTNSDNKNESNKKINDKDNNIRNDNMDKERIKLYNFDLESKENENGNKENNISNNGFYDDIDINTNSNNKVNEREKSDVNFHNESDNEKRFNMVDMNIDPPHTDQDFLGNLELIQRNNNKPQDEKEVKNNNNIINNDNNNINIKEIESEYEFNLSQEKFYKPLNKYENIFNFGKINRFKS